MEAQLKDVELEKKALSWPEKAKAITITNQQTYEQAANFIVAIATLEKEIKDHHKPIKDAANKAHKEAVAAEKRLLDPLLEAKGIINRRLGAWTQEQERIRQEAERKAREEAQKREEEARLKLAEEAAKQGATEETQMEILDTPIPMPQPVAAPTYRPISGVSGRTYWKWRIVDANQIPREYLMVDEMKINGIVRAMKQSTKIPGIEVYPDTGMTVRVK